MKLKRKELWKVIELGGEESKYLISNYGNVKNSKSGKILKPTTDRYGYLYVVLVHKQKRYTKKIHRLVAKAFKINNSPEIKTTVDHRDFNKKNNFEFNLKWETAEENCSRSHRLGNHTYDNIKGSKHGMAKFTEEMVHHVCKLLEKGKLSYSKISDKTGVSIGMIKQIASNKNWKHISSQYRITFND